MNPVHPVAIVFCIMTEVRYCCILFWAIVGKSFDEQDFLITLMLISLH